MNPNPKPTTDKKGENTAALLPPLGSSTPSSTNCYYFHNRILKYFFVSIMNSIFLYNNKHLVTVWCVTLIEACRRK